LEREKAAATSGRRRDVAALHTKRSGRSERLDIGDAATGSNFKCDGAREEERHRRSSYKRPQGGGERALDTVGPEARIWCDDTREEERYRRSSGRPEGGVAFQILMPRG
jgi:hypothetical protein